MTRKRRNHSSSRSDRSNSANSHRSISPSPSRYRSSHHHHYHHHHHSAHSRDDGSTRHSKNSSSGRHMEDHKDSRHHHRVHNVGDLKMDGGRSDRYTHGDKRDHKRGRDDSDGEYRRLRNDNEVRERHAREEEKRMKIYVKDEKGKDRNPSSKYGSHKSVKKEVDRETNRKPSTSDAQEERFKRDHLARPQDRFGEYLRGDHDKEQKPKIEKEKPNFEPSGKLAEDTNTYRGVVIKYNEPSDAHMPKLRWRLYPFKGDEALPVLYIHRQSAYLIGRERKIADIPMDHPSCSKQHAVFQYRLTPMDLPDGTTTKRVRPYIIDLGSTNGTYLNDERIEPQRFVELREKDVLKFGFSTREFVLLNEKSQEAEDAETVKKEEQSPS